MSKLFKPKAGHRAAIRMYCQGFGDCFLLAFKGSGNKVVRIVIDCGLVFKAKRERERMVEVTNLLHDHTGGVIDILVVTHEHYDHLCGFNHARDIWKTFTIKDLWLAWTENPDDEVADQIAIYKENALNLVANAMARLPLGADERAEAQSLLDSMRVPGAEDVDPGDSLNLLGAYSKQSGRAMDLVKSLYPGTPNYLDPGDVEQLPGTDFHAVIMGPPKNPEKIADLLGEPGDTFGHLKDEVDATAVELGLKPRLPAGSYEESLKRALAIPDEEEPRYLFARQYCFRVNDQFALDVRDQERWDKLTTRDGSPRAETDPKTRYEGLEDRWRRIDGTQFGVASRLAMQLDTLTNNVSLAIAFRLDASTTLLFPGDAQVGNWKSWGDQKYMVNGQEIDVADLLRSTRVYKVGHHASHNGTCRPDRFDRLPSLVHSFMPFEPVSYWPSIPSIDLVGALEARGPVARSDLSGLAPAPFEIGPVSEIMGRPSYVDLHVR